jgi:outer membrane protein OmpA-like peptidoglycan-associated protein
MMKRFMTFLVALMLLVTGAKAQTVQYSRLFENTQITLTGGVITTNLSGLKTDPFFWDGAKEVASSFRPVVGLEFTKLITPVFGLSVEGLTMYGTTGSNTWIDQMNIVGNMKFNLSNWFGGYKGEPRVFEVVFVPGLGLGHDFGDVHGVFRNYWTYNLGAELNVNLGKQKAWQINVKPVAMWNNVNRELTPRFNNMQLRLQFGVTYKFGSKAKKSHNFVLCPYSVTEAEYKALRSDYDKLLAKAPEIKEVVKEVVVEKEVVKVEKEYIIPSTTVPFQIGSAVISKTELKKLQEYIDSLPEGVTVSIVGSADTETGTMGRNETLAEERMNAVKSVLSDNPKVKNIIGTTGLDVNPVPADSRVAVIRVATK